MEKIELEPGDKANLLAQKLRSLEILAGAYDQGERGVAPELASILFVLLIHEGSNQSLVVQLGMQSLHFPTIPSYVVSKDNLLPENGLIYAQVSGAEGNSALDFVPSMPTDSLEKIIEMPAKNWLKELVIKDATGRKWSRQEIIKQVRNLEGAHSDAKVSKAFLQLKFGNPLGVGFMVGLEDNPVELPMPPYSAIYASIRQLAESTLMAFRKYVSVTNEHGTLSWPKSG